MTLLEMLVVIAIIGVLAGITLPVLRSAKRDADSSLCKSNLRTVGHAFSLYASDHSDRFPVFPFQPDPDGVIRQDLTLERWMAVPNHPQDAGTQILVLPTDQVPIWSHPLRTYISEEAPDAPFKAEEIVTCPVVFRDSTATGGPGVADPPRLAAESHLQSPALFIAPSAWASGARVSINRDYAAVLVSGVAHPSNKSLLVERRSYHSGRREPITQPNSESFNVLAVDGHASTRFGDRSKPVVAIDGRRAGGLPCSWCNTPVPYLTTAAGADGTDW